MTDVTDRLETILKRLREGDRLNNLVYVARSYSIGDLVTDLRGITETLKQEAQCKK